MQTQEAQRIELPPMGTVSPQQASQRGRTHWVWTPFRDINNMGPIEIKSQIGYRDQRWTKLRRCVPYPLGNLIESKPNLEEAATAHHSSLSIDSSQLSRVEHVKYAQDQADELRDSYFDEGLRKLTPLLGEDDGELVGRIFRVVQPFEYEIHEMAHEFTVGASGRIAQSDLSDTEKAKAVELANIMAAGAKAAETRAIAEYEALISSMSDKMAGGPGIANPSTAYQSHAWICKQLNKPVPARIDRTGGGNNQSAAIDILAKRALREESAAESMTAQLEEERAARKALENRLTALEDKKTKVA
jgi:hypothetical protein